MKKRYLVAAAAAAVGSSLVSGQAKAAGTYTIGGLENNFYIRTTTANPPGFVNPGTQINGQPTNGSGSGIQVPGLDGNTSGSAITVTGTVTAVLEQPGTFDGKTYG